MLVTVYCRVYCPGRHFPSVSKDAVHFAWPAIVETSCTKMKLDKSTPLHVSNAAAAQAAAVLVLAAAREAQGSRLSGDGWLYFKYSVLLPGASLLPAAAKARRKGEDGEFVGSIKSWGVSEAAGSERSVSSAIVVQSTWTRGPGRAEIKACLVGAVYKGGPGALLENQGRLGGCEEGSQLQGMDLPVDSTRMFYFMQYSPYCRCSHNNTARCHRG